jgi:hypothetical protein
MLDAGVWNARARSCPWQSARRHGMTLLAAHVTCATNHKAGIKMQGPCQDDRQALPFPSPAGYTRIDRCSGADPLGPSGTPGAYRALDGAVHVSPVHFGRDRHFCLMHCEQAPKVQWRQKLLQHQTILSGRVTSASAGYPWHPDSSAPACFQTRCRPVGRNGDAIQALAGCSAHRCDDPHCL